MKFPLIRIVAVVAICSVFYAASGSPVPTAWVLRADGIGPVNVGMTLAQLNAALNEKFARPQEKEEQTCFYVSPARHPGVAIMIENGRASRIDVGVRGIPTERGAQVGDSEKQVKSLYGAAVKVEPHAYTGEEGGHYLTVRSGRYAIRFNTRDSQVKSVYSGLFSAVQYIEGCE
jgi:hypothetical protein